MPTQTKRNNMGDINVISLISGLLVAIGSLIGSIITIKKVKAEIEKEKAAVKVSEAGLSTDIIAQAKNWLGQQGVYIDSLQTEVAKLRAEVDKLKKDQAVREETYQSYIRYLLRNIKDLTQQLCDNGMMPNFTPLSFGDYTDQEL